MESDTIITIKEIAQKASVSITTVSRVLNGQSNVADATREKVLKIIAELDYKPNLFAQGLAGGQTKTIGVQTQLLGSPVFDVILRGILKGLEGSGYSALFSDGGWDAAKDAAAIQMFIKRQVDGLIILNGNSPDDFLNDISRQVPLIVIGRKIKGIEKKCVAFDDFDAAFKATKYLIEMGHRRIAHITGLPNHKDANERRDGYFAALREADIIPDPNLVVEGDFTEPSGMLAIEMLLMRGHMFSAIFAANDQMAYGARLALYRRDLRVPQDVSIVGFDDQAPSAYMIPPLTSISRPPLEIGEATSVALIKMIQGQKSVALPKYESNLMIRESVNRRM